MMDKQESFTVAERDLAEEMRPKNAGVFFFEDLSVADQQRYLNQARKKLSNAS
jgi:hypothetical protein